MDKNRYRDVLPYDRCRVRLRAYEAQPGSDYINASFVPVRTKQGGMKKEARAKPCLAHETPFSLPCPRSR